MSAGLPDALADAARTLRGARLADLFARDPERVARLSFRWNDWHVDLSKECLTPDVLQALVAHAQDAGLERWIAALFAGEKINLSETRPALHTALRAEGNAPILVDGRDVMTDVSAAQARVRILAETLRGSARHGASGKPIGAVVHLGIGGSDLGPRLVCDALADPGTPSPVPVRFVSNVDPEHLARALAGLDPATTLFVVASKSFTTEETMANAVSARAWLAAAMPARAAVAGHFVAVTANAPAARTFGIADADILPLWDWVGGRFSLWSAAGLPIAIAHGNDTFDTLRGGAAAMDAHFRTAPLEANLPVLLGLTGWWNARVLGHAQRVVVPYAQALAALPAYLQQTTLESNGKRVTRDGRPVDGPTAPALWGGTGTDGQHAFFQWLHQGTHSVPVEFVVPVRSRHSPGSQQTLLVAHALAQAQALLAGRAGDPAHACPGDRPSTMLLLPTLDAHHLGALLALWEHRTFVEGVLAGINSFDQFGVELGKSLAPPIVAALADGVALPAGTDASTRALVDVARQMMAGVRR